MQLLGTDAVRIVRYDGESGVVLAGSGQPEVTPPGFRFPLDGDTVAARIFRQGKPARQDDYKEVGGLVVESVRAAGIRSDEDGCAHDAANAGRAKGDCGAPSLRA